MIFWDMHGMEPGKEKVFWVDFCIFVLGIDEMRDTFGRGTFSVPASLQQISSLNNRFLFCE